MVKRLSSVQLNRNNKIVNKMLSRIEHLLTNYDLKVISDVNLFYSKSFKIKAITQNVKNLAVMITY